jgi:membrane-bound ClpP family serine protease
MTAAVHRTRSAAQSGMLWRHLVGGYSLGRSYWLHMVLLGWCLAFVAAWFLNALAERSTVRSTSIALLVIEPLLLVAWMWSVIGAAVSALRNLFAGPSRFWAAIALLFIALSLVGGSQELRRLGAANKEHWAVALGKQPTESFVIALSADGRIITFTGGVNDGAATAIDRAIGAAPNVGTLVLDSPGGWLKEGIRMAEVVKRYRLNTRVEKQCFSACTLVLLAGENRSAGDGAQIGFHRGRAIGESPRNHQHPAAKEEADLYRKAGLRDAFVARIVSTPNDSILIPSRRELLHEDVLTR